MLISHSKKLIFIHVHRTGGSSAGNVFRSKEMGCRDTFSQHSNAMTVEDSFFEKYFDYYTFGFTRNPWERMLSWYSLLHFNDQKSLTEERQRLESFIEYDAVLDSTNCFFHYNSLDYFTNKKGDFIADKIFRFEKFHAEILRITDRFNVKSIEIPCVNVTSPKDYREYYTDKSRKLIEEKCRKDIEYFNYTF